MGLKTEVGSLTSWKKTWIIATLVVINKHTWQFVPLCSAMWAVCICPNNQSISLNSSTVFLRIFPSYSVCICPSNQQHFFDFFNSISLNLVKHISKIQFLLIFQQHFFDYFPAYSKNDSWQRKKPPVLIMDEEDAGLSFNFSFFHQSPDYSFACKRMGESESGFSFPLGSQPFQHFIKGIVRGQDNLVSIHHLYRPGSHQWTQSWPFLK